jgi:hypothetical protein
MKIARLTLAAALLGAAVHGAFAQATLDHAKAMAGGVTPGDTPGYPVTLSASGHYVLTGNLAVPAGTAGIVITSPHVTLDLNGFSVAGPVSCTQDSYTLAVTCNAASDYTITGIQANELHDIVIRNGSVRGFAGYGIHSAGHSVVENVGVSSNSYIGLAMTANRGGLSRVSGSRFWLNGSRGAYVKGALVERSSFSSNHLDGLYVERSTVIDSMAQHNGDRGIEGDSHNPGAGNVGTPTTIKGVTLLANKNGSHQGHLFSLGGNFNGASVF